VIDLIVYYIERLRLRLRLIGVQANDELKRHVCYHLNVTLTFPAAKLIDSSRIVFPHVR